MKYKISAILILCAASLVVYGVSVAPSNPFQDGDLLSAGTMNTKFDNVSTAIDELDAIHGPIYNAADYVGVGNVTEKRFTLIGFGLGACQQTGTERNQSVWTYQDNGGGVYTKTQVRGDGVTDCQTITNVVHLGSGYHWRSFSNVAENNTLNSTFPTQVTKLKQQMRIGDTWADEVHDINDFIMVEKNTLVGHVASVATTAKSFNDCLKVHTLRHRNGGNAASFSRITYYCRNVGQVKRVQGNMTGTGQVWNLTSCTSNDATCN